MALERNWSLGRPAGLAGHGIGEGQQVVAAGQRQFHGLEQVQVAVHRAGAVVALHGVLQTADRCIIPHVLRGDQPAGGGALGLQQHTRHGALVKVEQEWRALAGRDHVNHLVE